MLAAVLSAALFSLVGCSGEEAPAKDPTPPAVEAAPKLDAATLKAAAENIALVPSPAEMQKALEKNGIQSGLSALVPERQLKMDIENKDVVAVRTGVVLADALLTVKDAPNDKLSGRLELVKAGMSSLGAGADFAATIDDINARIANNSVSRDDLVKELDEMHGAIIPELKYEAGERCVPLIQAGSWLAGSNLVAKAIVAAANEKAGTELLRQPQVADYFLKYVQVEGAGKAPDAVIQQLDTTLKSLKAISEKPSLTLDDVKDVQAQTDAVLALL
jgi:PBP1b-binding outer membrane lipoprotein LpoB